MSATDPRTERLSAEELDAADWLAGNERVDIPSDVRALIELLTAEVRAVDTRVQQLTEALRQAEIERDELLDLVWVELSIGDGPCIHRLRNGDCAVCGSVKELRGSIALRGSVLAEVDASQEPAAVSGERADQ